MSSDLKQYNENLQLFPIRNGSFPGFKIIKESVFIALNLVDKVQIVFDAAWLSTRAAVCIHFGMVYHGVFNPDLKPAILVKFQAGVMVVVMLVFNYLLSDRRLCAWRFGIANHMENRLPFLCDGDAAREFLLRFFIRALHVTRYKLVFGALCFDSFRLCAIWEEFRLITAHNVPELVFFTFYTKQLLRLILD